jgi:hypothetical protein
LRLLRSHGLLRGRHVLELLAQFGEADLEFVHGVVQRLNLSGDLVDLPGAILLLFVDGSLQFADRGSPCWRRLVFWSSRFFMTPMRSSKDCFIAVICCCSWVTWVCSSIISLLAP